MWNPYHMQPEPKYMKGRSTGGEEKDIVSDCEKGAFLISTSRTVIGSWLNMKNSI